MIEGVQALIQKGAAYPTADGTVYYRTRTKADYGKLSQKPLEDLQSGARVDVDPNKENPLDFALWKGVLPDDPDYYDSPWGHGRPGWHMECSTMIHGILGDQIDIHAGGADLIFPHHENEIAQSEAWTGKDPFVKYWMHNGFVNVSGEKMSKSLGNFSTIKKVLERYDANTIRYFLLTHHYRMPVDFNDEALEGAKNWAAAKFSNLKELCQTLDIKPEDIKPETSSSYLFDSVAEALAAETQEESEDRYLTQFYELLTNDLNTSQGLALLNQVISKVNAYGQPSQLDRERQKTLMKKVLTMLNVFGFQLSVLFESQALPQDELQTIYKELTGQWLEADKAPEVLLQQILDLRKKAKEIKNWTQADAIRKHLSDIGIQIKDNKDGTTTWELLQK
jgi:cysteinyl-tRNA synthetase